MNEYKEEDFTDWFPPTSKMKPVHVGAYPTKLPVSGVEAVQYWDGRDWGLRCLNAAGCYRSSAARTISSRFQNVLWRGLKEKPE